MQMKNKEPFELVASFEVGDDSLAGLSPGYVFSLGVEWEIFRQRLSSGSPFVTLCLPENRTRFVNLAERPRRFVEDRPPTGTGWVEIWVGDRLSFVSSPPQSS